MSTPHLPSGTVTFLLTDIEGSCLSWESDPASMARALERHDAILSACVERFGGFVVKSRGEGDSCFAVFERACDGVSAACAIQREIQREPWPSDLRLQTRAAIHTGEALERGGDYFGRAVNRCARLREGAHGGQTLVSGVASALAQENLPDDVTMRPLGSHVLRDMDRPEDVFQLDHAEIPSDFPPLRFADARLNNLPSQLTELVGRASEANSVRRLLANHRLVCITGMGGSGKTRLAVQLGGDSLGDFRDGVWFVDLSSIDQPSDVAPAIAEALHISDRPGEPLIDAIVDYAVHRDLLLVMDNCEHVVESCAGVIIALLGGASRLHFLATSREPLGVPGEVVYELSGLAVPAATGVSLSDAADSDAVRLFTDRARRVRPDFVLSERNAIAIAALCRAVDGLPLGIELAAARVRSMSVDDLAKNIDHRLALLTSGLRTSAPRHRTLRHTLDWSHDLLSDREQIVLRRLSAFAGAFTLEAAAAVASDADTRSGVVRDTIASLVAKSMVAADADMAGASIYRLLKTVQEYGRERLVAAGELQDTAHRHAEYYVSIAEQAGPELRAHAQSAWLNRLEAEHAELRRVLEPSAAHGDPELGLKLAATIWRYWHLRGYMSEGRKTIEQLLVQAGAHCEPRLLAKSHRAAGTLAYYQGDIASARSHYESDLAHCRAIGDTDGATRALNNLGLAAQAGGDNAAARLLFEECLDLLRPSGQDYAIATVLTNLGLVARAQADMPCARAFLEESLALAKAVDDKPGVGAAHVMLGYLALDQGDVERAEDDMAESLAVRRQVGDRWGEAESLLALGELSRRCGDNAAAQRLLWDALTLGREIDDQWTVAEALSELAFVALADGRHQSAHDQFEQSLSLWRDLDHKAGLAKALAGKGRLECDRGDVAVAALLHQEALDVRTNAADVKGVADSHDDAACLAARAGEGVVAHTFAAAADAIRNDVGLRASPCDDRRLARCLSDAGRDIGDQGRHAARARGMSMPLEQAAAEVRDWLSKLAQT